MILDKLKSWGFAALALALAGLLGLQTWRLHTEQIAHGELKVQVERDKSARATAAVEAAIDNADRQATHASSTQENSDVFTSTRPARDATVSADLAVAQRLRRDAERRAATYRAMAEANAAACRDLADRHATLDAHVVRGVEVVAGLRGDLARRDAEVRLLRGQIDIDRALLTTTPRRPDGGTIEGSP